MPLSEPNARSEIHHRVIDMKAYARDDGLYDVEAHLLDCKPFPFKRNISPHPVPAGQSLHDLWIRLTLDDEFVVQRIEASSDVTPYAVCKEAELTLSVLVGERIARGWTSLVKERLRGAKSCTHLMELLIPLGTTALQGIRGLQRQRKASEKSFSEDPRKIDSCYAYGRQREIVMQLWPEHYQAPEGKTPS